eukprot:134048-Rhodomonas_salina.1
MTLLFPSSPLLFFTANKTIALRPGPRPCFAIDVSAGQLCSGLSAHDGRIAGRLCPVWVRGATNKATFSKSVLSRNGQSRRTTAISYVLHLSYA